MLLHVLHVINESMGKLMSAVDITLKEKCTEPNENHTSALINQRALFAFPMNANRKRIRDAIPDLSSGLRGAFRLRPWAFSHRHNPAALTEIKSLSPRILNLQSFKALSPLRFWYGNLWRWRGDERQLGLSNRQRRGQRLWLFQSCR